MLREKLGPEAAQALVELLDRTTRQTRDQVVLLAEERFGRRLAEAETRFEQRLAQLETRFERRFADFEGRLERRLTDVIRWMVGLWILGIGTMLGVLFTFFKP